MLKRFGAGVVLGTFTACGAQVDDGRNTGNLNAGGSASSAGGTISYSTGAGGGNMFASTGGSTGICGGMFTGSCSVTQFVNVSSCDIPLQWSPDIATVTVAINCQYIAQIKLDAGTADGYYIDYSQTPSHLVLTGSDCAFVAMYGVQSVVLIKSCSNQY